jgi:hypothetical protein
MVTLCTVSHTVALAAQSRNSVRECIKYFGSGGTRFELGIYDSLIKYDVDMSTAVSIAGFK